MAKKRPPLQHKKAQASTFIQNGQIEEAIRLLAPLCSKHPRDIEAWMLLAAAHGQQGDLDGVTVCAQHVLAQAPNHAQAHSLLGNTLAARGQHQEALASYRRALCTLPNDPGILNNLANALYLSGQHEEALDILARVVQLRPDYADAYNNMGNICKTLNRNNDAIQHYQRALTLNPKQHEVLLNLGSIYNDRLGYPEGAQHCFRQALALKPDSREAQYGMANSLRFMGKLEESLGIIRTLIKNHPDDTTAIASEADALDRLGRFDEAYERIRMLIDTGEVNAMALEVFTRLCRRYDSCAEALQRGEQLLMEYADNEINKQTLHFSLGKLYDKLDNCDRAFKHFRAANDLTGVPYDHAARVATIDGIINAYNPELFARLSRPALEDKRPVFIVGMPRSGTSLTEQILASHPAVYGAGELNEFNDMAAGLAYLLNSRRGYPDCISELSPSVADKLAKRYKDRLDSFSRKASRITDKMPHNFMNLGLITLLFPGARIIHCTRDPRDTCLSVYFQNFGWLHQYATRLEDLGAYYLEYQRLMQYWESVLDIPILTIEYERMVTAQEDTSRELVEFCGLDWDERCLQYHESERAVATASYDQVRQPIYTRSLARWKHYRQHIGPLLDIFGDTDTAS